MYPMLGIMKEYIKNAGLEISDVDEVIGVAKSVFGIGWLEECAKKIGKNKNPFLQHPILIGCTSGSFSQFMELLELCTYIVSFKDDKELIKIISGLKERKSYEDFLFHLAMAYRFKKLGFKVALEPLTANGRSADFSAYLGDMNVMAECTVSREWATSEEIQNAFFEIQNIFKKIHYKSTKQLNIDIITKRNLRFEDIKELKGFIIQAGNEFIKIGKPLKMSREFYDISISEVDEIMKKQLKNRKMNDDFSKGWHQIIVFGLGTLKIPGDISSVDLTETTPESVLRYKSLMLPEEEFAYSFDDKIDKKISDKFNQLRAHPNDHTSILFLKVSDKLKKTDPERVGMRIWNGIFKKVSSVNAVFLIERQWVNNLKHQHQGTLFNNINNPINEHLFFGFNTVEKDMDFVKEWRNVMKQ